jgi:hypothetical protein
MFSLYTYIQPITIMYFVYIALEGRDGTLGLFVYIFIQF